jgi:hypothetical protein
LSPSAAIDADPTLGSHSPVLRENPRHRTLIEVMQKGKAVAVVAPHDCGRLELNAQMKRAANLLIPDGRMKLNAQSGVGGRPTCAGSIKLAVAADLRAAVVGGVEAHAAPPAVS